MKASTKLDQMFEDLQVEEPRSLVEEKAKAKDILRELKSAAKKAGISKWKANIKKEFIFFEGEHKGNDLTFDGWLEDFGDNWGFIAEAKSPVFLGDVEPSLDFDDDESAASIAKQTINELANAG